MAVGAGQTPAARSIATLPIFAINWMMLTSPPAASAIAIASSTTSLTIPLTSSVHCSGPSTQRALQSCLPAGHYPQQTGPTPS